MDLVTIVGAGVGKGLDVGAVVGHETLHWHCETSGEALESWFHWPSKVLPIALHTAGHLLWASSLSSYAPRSTWSAAALIDRPYCMAISSMVCRSRERARKWMMGSAATSVV